MGHVVTYFRCTDSLVHGDRLQQSSLVSIEVMVMVVVSSLLFSVVETYRCHGLVTVTLLCHRFECRQSELPETEWIVTSIR